jgi:hydroxyacyl-ACP dehydratase HTD2-like protein with hotdog domain
MSTARPQRYVDDVAVGEDLPTTVKNASRAQLFLYSAATWNPHRIHYDRDYARVEGQPDVVVHGPLQGAWLTQYVTGWAGPLGRLLAASWQHRGSAYADVDYELHGRVVTVDDSTGDVSIDVWEQTVDGQRLMPGRAVVRLPRRDRETAG